ncbi:DEAD/DEAH box helicase [Stieleria marina]|uniref:ATP-dependent RNA helicase RhlE n=1 Tax=Stieleria marina TaxID=1930275 RepID=A0A517P1K1_9BACT|nr:ATP-dependent RNA helicase RhlE [Planctomycetes bacterium K23_9]
MKTFEEMDLFGPIKRALADQNYETPTPIQAETIPPAIAGQDILGCAQTGTGKTAAFALPILDYLGQDKPAALKNRPAALILAPTRELAIQIGDSFKTYGKHVRFQQALVYGGVGQGQQVSALRGGVHVLIATPGRLIDLMDQGHINLSQIEMFVLDEADRMMDMGFLPALKKIIAKLPEERQSLFFSATLPPKIQELASSLLFNPVHVDVTPKTTSVKQIDQCIRLVQRSEKVDNLHKILTKSGTGQTIVFTRTKHGANGLVKKLDRLGVTASAIHGNKTQGARQRALKAFRDFNIQVLVATDVAARGIDIDGVTHVVNYDMPVEPESYVHRVGRTGRAGAEGIAISFCTNEEVEELRAIERLIGQSLKVENPNLFDLNRPAKKQPKKSGGRSNGGQDSGGNGRSRRRKTKQSGSTSGNSQQPASGNRSFRFRKAKKKSNGSTGRSTSSV